MVEYKQIEKGVYEDEIHGVRAEVQEPRGDWDYHYLTVRGGKNNRLTLFEGELSPSNVKQIAGVSDQGMSTSANVFLLVENAASDYGIELR